MRIEQLSLRGLKFNLLVRVARLWLRLCGKLVARIRRSKRFVWESIVRVVGAIGIELKFATNRRIRRIVKFPLIRRSKFVRHVLTKNRTNTFRSFVSRSANRQTKFFRGVQRERSKFPEPTTFLRKFVTS